MLNTVVWYSVHIHIRKTEHLCSSAVYCILCILLNGEFNELFRDCEHVFASTATFGVHAREPSTTLAPSQRLYHLPDAYIVC